MNSTYVQLKKNLEYLKLKQMNTHLAVSIGIAAAKKRYSTYFIKCHDLKRQNSKID